MRTIHSSMGGAIDDERPSYRRNVDTCGTERVDEAFRAAMQEPINAGAEHAATVISKRPGNSKPEGRFLLLTAAPLKEKAPAGETRGLTDRSRCIGGCRGMPSVRIHVDGGFAVGASSFNRQESPRSFSCATA